MNEKLIWSIITLIFLFVLIVSLINFQNIISISYEQIPSISGGKYTVNCLSTSYLGEEIANLKFELCQTQNTINQIVSHINNPLVKISNIIAIILSLLGCIISFKSSKKIK